MHTFYRISDLKYFLNSFPKTSIGFVPTMGALHEAHLSLVKKSKAQNELTLCSIFVNPAQFDKEEDLINYPRFPEKDICLLKSVGCDVCFFPSSKEMYPNGFDQMSFLSLANLDQTMEGAYRVGHFQGVVAVVRRFFEIVAPNRAYFGEKDFQQLCIIRYMTEQLKIPVEIIGLPIIREADGLAMSSRNIRLEPHERDQAAIVCQTLKKVRRFFLDNRFDYIDSYVKSSFLKSPFGLEYFSIADENSLERCHRFDPLKQYRAFVAVLAKNVRLIDNIPLY